MNTTNTEQPIQSEISRLKKFVYDILLEWTDFDPNGQISFVIDAKFSEAAIALEAHQAQAVNKARLQERKEAFSFYCMKYSHEQLGEILRGWVERLEAQDNSKQNQTDLTTEEKMLSEANITGDTYTVFKESLNNTLGDK